MTEENKRENIKSELDRASKAMDAAILLFENGFLNDAVSRLYYFLLYNMRAVLLTEGLEPKSHGGLLRLLGLHFVKKGIFETKVSHIFAKLMKYREEADYNPSYVFSRDDFVEFRRDAEYLAGKIREYLVKKGYL